MASGLENTATGTLTANQVRTRAQALQEEQLRQAQLRTQQATEQAGQAEQEFEQAAQAPSPELDPLSVALPTLLSGIASVISQDPSFRENAERNILLQKRDLLKRRAQNLSQLRDVFLLRAEEAQKAGAAEDVIKFRNQFERLSKQVDELEQRAGGGRAMSKDEILANMDPEMFEKLVRRTGRLAGARTQKKQADTPTTPKAATKPQTGAQVAGLILSAQNKVTLDRALKHLTSSGKGGGIPSKFTADPDVIRAIATRWQTNPEEIRAAGMRAVRRRDKGVAGQIVAAVPELRDDPQYLAVIEEMKKAVGK